MIARAGTDFVKKMRVLCYAGYVMGYNLHTK